MAIVMGPGTEGGSTVVVTIRVKGSFCHGVVVWVCAHIDMRFVACRKGMGARTQK